MYDVADGLQFMPNCLADENKHSIHLLTTFIILWECDDRTRLDSELWEASVCIIDYCLFYNNK